MGAELAPQKIPGLQENGFNLYDQKQLLEIHDRLESMNLEKLQYR